MSIVKTKTQLINDLVNCANAMQNFASNAQQRMDNIVDAVSDEGLSGNWMFRTWNSGLKEYFSFGLTAAWSWTDIDTAYSYGKAEIALPENMNAYTAIAVLSGNAPPMMLSTMQEANKIIVKAISLPANKPTSSAFNIVLYKIS